MVVLGSAQEIVFNTDPAISPARRKNRLVLQAFTFKNLFTILALFRPEVSV